VGLFLAAALFFFAQNAPAANTNHFKAAPGPHNYLVTNHPAVLPHLTPSVWLLTSYAKDPLVYRDESGVELQRIVEHAVTADVAAALGLFERFEIAATLPGVYLNGPGFDGQGLNSAALADLRLMGKALLTPWNQGLVASARVVAEMPVAQLNPDAGPIAGDTWPNLTPGLQLGVNSQWVRIGLDVGYLLRNPSNVGDLVVGHEITYGAATEISLVPRALYATVDLNGRAAPSFLFASRDQFPLEIAGALKYFVGPIVLVGGAGTGLVPDYGTPEFRAFAGIGYYNLPPSDRDGDGIIDEDDDCPDDPETVNGYLDEDGCPDKVPEEGDRDGDGIMDSEDDCPDAPEDKDGYQDEDGCPDVDNDKDGILDKDDACPMEPEDRDRWEDADGCPDPDNDQDKILDVDDECPNDPETYNGNQDEDGCPDGANVKVIVKRDRVEILDKVFFAYDSDRILPKSFGLLDNVARVINDHTEIPKISVEGHTDSDGSNAYNLDLSRRRARSVMAYLVAADVDPERLEFQGHGEERPIDTNSTEKGKAKNRRVEFRILGEDGEVTDSASDAPGSDDDEEEFEEPTEPEGDVTEDSDGDEEDGDEDAGSGRKPAGGEDSDLFVDDEEDW
jgi:outer membrane protein OmpA-like peptidoglycan-associated protein